MNHRDKVNNTSLFYATKVGNFEIVNYLIENRADVNIFGDDKKTALFYAKKIGSKEIVEFLVKKGAINTKDGKLSKHDLKKQ